VQRSRSFPVISIFQISIPKFTAILAYTRRSTKEQGRKEGSRQFIYADLRFARRRLRFPVSKLLSHILDNWPVCTPSRHLGVRSAPRQPSPCGTASSSGYNIAVRRPRRYGKNPFIVLHCFRFSSFVMRNPAKREKSMRKSPNLRETVK